MITECTKCGAVIPGGGSGSPCPACLLKAGLEEELPSTQQAWGPDSLDPAGAAVPGPREVPGSFIGRYRLLQEIGEGGFGIVYMAEQLEPVKRMVALKILKPGMDTREVVARFEAERQALALMDHPNIARVFDGGATESGRPYFVMELVKGVPLTKYCDEGNLDTKARLTLFLDVLAAVQHAHQKGIIHRDLKPSNIMVSPHDGVPVVKVIDFGIAKAVGMELTGRTLFTRMGAMIGTPQYMSPEQAEVNALDVDTRSDVYSLGVVLYELLTGRTPLDERKLREAGYAEMQRLIREEQPAKPSTRISTLGEAVAGVARHRSAEPSRLVRQVRGDLDWIVLKALEKDRSRRYATVSGLASDIRRHLTDEPVTARPPSLAYQLGRLARRHRGQAAAAAAIALTALAGLAATILSLRKARLSAEYANQESMRKQDEWLRAEKALYSSDLSLAARKVEDGRLNGVRELLERHAPPNCAIDFRGWEWAWLDAVLRQGTEVKLPPGTGGATALAAMPETGQAAVGFSNGAVGVYGGSAIALERVLPAQPGVVRSLVWNGKRRLLAAVSDHGPVRIWKEDGTYSGWETGGSGGDVQVLAWNSGGDMIAAGGAGGKVLIHFLDTPGKELTVDVGRQVLDLQWHPEEDTLAVSVAAGAIKLIHNAGSAPSVEPVQLQGERICWHPSGAFLSSASSQELLGKWSSNNPKPSYHRIHIGAVRCLKWSPDGRLIASGGLDRTVRFSGVSQENVTFPAYGHGKEVIAVAWRNPDELLSLGKEGKVLSWRPASPATHLARRFSRLVTGVSWAPDSSAVVVSDGTAAEVVDAVGGKTRYRLEFPAWAVDWSGNGTLIATGDTSGHIAVWSTLSKSRVAEFTLAGMISSLKWSPDDRRLLVSHRPPFKDTPSEGNVTVLDTINPEDRRTIEVPGVDRASWSPDGRQFAAGGFSRRVEIYDAATLKLTKLVDVWRDDIKQVVWSHNGGFLAVSGRDGRVVLYDAKSGKMLYDREDEMGAVQGLAWSVDDSRLASLSDDGRLVVRRTSDFERVVEMKAHSSWGFCVAWSPDGFKLVSGGNDFIMQLWSAVGSSPAPGH